MTGDYIADVSLNSLVENGRLSLIYAGFWSSLIPAHFM